MKIFICVCLLALNLQLASSFQDNLVYNGNEQINEKPQNEIKVKNDSTTFALIKTTRQDKATWRPSTGIIYYPNGTKEHSAPKCIETKPRLCFVDYGFPKIWRRYCNGISRVTFEKCVDFCVNILNEGACKVNGMVYRWNNGACNCIERSSGYYYVPGFIHYKFGR